MATSRLTTAQLREQGRYHRALSSHSVGYNSDPHKGEKDLLYRTTQEVMAEVYEELVAYREANEWHEDVKAS